MVAADARLNPNPFVEGEHERALPTCCSTAICTAVNLGRGSAPCYPSTPWDKELVLRYKGSTAFSYALVPSSKVFMTDFTLPFDLFLGEENHSFKARNVVIKKPASLGKS